MIQQRSNTELTPEVVTFTEARLSDEIFGVREEYLATSRRTIDETYGSLNEYLRDARITEADLTGRAKRCWAELKGGGLLASAAPATSAPSSLP